MFHPNGSAPDSPGSFHDATTTIDKLTLALSNYSRVPSPEPVDVSTCCCGREECECTKAWTAYKAKLESRLVLSAEIGQALLERHEAYVRRHELGNVPNDSPLLSLQSPDMKRTEEQVEARVAELLRENAVLEKRLSQALVNHEATDISYHDILEQLKQAQERTTQLSTQNARLVGMQTRLETTLQEKDDIQQERDSATQQARAAEARLTSLKETCSKLQSQIALLREDISTQRTEGQKLSDDVLSDARNRLRQLQVAAAGSRDPTDEVSGVTDVLESLVADNDGLRHDNAELQELLSSTREDLRAVQTELDERSMQYSEDNHDTIRRRSHSSAQPPLSPTFNFGTAPAPSVLHTVFQRSEAGPSSFKRPHSIERSFKRNAEPLTPETDRRPLSPTSLSKPSSSRPFIGQPFGRHTSSTMDDDHVVVADVFSGPSRAQRSLLSLTRSRAVQTDTTSWPNLMASPLARTFGDPSHDGQSEASSFDSNPSVVGVIVERTAQLLGRLLQADALTLTNRLKRQRLLGADVSHLSRNTVSAILNESTNLRTQFRAFLEDEKVVTTCTRRDLRALFKLFKDMFTEMGQLRVTLNDVILDPTVAGRVSEMAMHPSKTTVKDGERSNAVSATPAWMAPISKFLGLPSGSDQEDAASRALAPPVRSNNRTITHLPPRIVPKREAALSASTITVNVDFSGTGGGRAAVSATSGPSSIMPTASSSTQLSMISADSSRSVMDIFAGAPRANDTADPWVVVPTPRRGALGGRRFDMAGGATIGRSALRRAASTAAGLSESTSSGLSRAVDAVIDLQTSPSLQGEEARDTVPDTLLERTLRPRGLSDSSIHTTFKNHSDAEEAHGSLSGTGNASTGASAGSKPPSMLQTLSRKMQNFRLASASFAAARPPVGVPTTSVTTETSTAVSSLSRPHTPDTHLSSEREGPRIRQPSGRSVTGSGLLTTIAASFAPNDLDAEVDAGLHRALSPNFQTDRPRDEDAFGRNWERGREL